MPRNLRQNLRHNLRICNVRCVSAMRRAAQRVSHHWMGGDATTSHQSRQHEPRLISTLSEAFGGLTGYVAVRYQSLMYTCTVRSCSRTLPRSACHPARRPARRRARRLLPRSLALYSITPSRRARRSCSCCQAAR